MKIELILLTLIRLRPDVTGYQLAALIEACIGHVAGIHLSKIYPALKKLSEQGYVVFRSVPSKGRPDQKYYAITPEGEEAFQEMIRKPFNFRPTRNAFDDYVLKLACMSTIDREVVLDHIDQGIAFITSNFQPLDTCADNEFVASFMADAAGGDYDPTIELWDDIRAQFINEREGRLAWLKQLRKKYEDLPD